MLHNILASSEVLQAYHILPLSGFRCLTDEMRNVLEEVDKPNKGGKKKGTKFGLFEPTPFPKKSGKRKPEVEPLAPAKAPKRKRIKKMACQPRTPTPRDHDDSQSQTVSNVPIQMEFHNEEDVSS